jgi:hypothetical protein
LLEGEGGGVEDVEEGEGDVEVEVAGEEDFLLLEEVGLGGLAVVDGGEEVLQF